MHCDTIQQDKEDGVEEEKRIVHEPPRRVFVTLDPFDVGVTISDYLYPGEGSEDCISNIKELFGWQISEDNIEDDVEIVASPRDTRGPPPSATSRNCSDGRYPRTTSRMTWRLWPVPETLGVLLHQQHQGTVRMADIRGQHRG